MGKFTLSTDSCCDELKSVLKKNNINYIAMSYILEDEIFEDHFDSMQDYINFYNNMKSGKQYTTTGLNPFQVKEYFEQLLKDNGKDIVHITLSSGLSGTHQVVQSVADELNATSENKIYVVDSRSATQGQNLILNYAKNLSDKGLNAEDAAQKMREAIKKLKVFFFLNDLESLKRGGRLSGAQAVMAKIMQLRPVLTFNSKGELEVIEKVMGSKKTIRTLFNYYTKFADRSFETPLYLPYSGFPDGVLELKNLFEDKLGITNIIVKPVGPVISSHTGPVLTGIVFIGK